MTKAELTEKLIDRLIDPWTDCPEDYEGDDLLTLEEATSTLEALRMDDEAVDDPDFRVPEGTTPELLMEVMNCLIRKNQHELRVRKLSEWLTDHEMVCEYDQYKDGYDPDAVTVLPVDFVCNADPGDFPFSSKDKLDTADFIEIGKNSWRTFSFADNYCWYDDSKRQLYSTDTPFHDEVIDARAFAEYILSDAGKDCREYLIEGFMDDWDVKNIFGEEN